MRVRLTRKLAECLDGVDVSRFHIGEIVELPDAEAAVLIAERWAEPASGATLPKIRLQEKPSSTI